MRVLWISTTPGLYNDKQWGYNGGGWIASLQQLFEHNVENCELGFAFPSSVKGEKEKRNHTTYYPIEVGQPSAFAKIKWYYGGYKKHDANLYREKLLRAIEDFQPDVIHLFGVENKFADVVRFSEVPVIVHLQGLLAPYDNAFWPINLNKSSFVWPPSFREWVKRNGYLFAKNSMHVRGEREKELFKHVRHCMGRTEWDFQVSRLLSPQSTYQHVDEVLRDVFYQHAGCWQPHESGKLKIVSTISETIYKGLDVILKTAHLLATETSLNFEWQVVGINKRNRIVHIFENATGIKSKDVHIKYLGTKSAEELCQTLLDSDVYVHPSYIDNSPNSVCESQMIGLPTIACNVGGVGSLIHHGEDGLLVPANAPYELAYYIKELSINNELMQKISTGAALTASKRHDKKQILNDLLSAYKAVIG